MPETGPRPVRWTRPALTGLAEIVAYLADKNPDAAARLIERLRRRAASLSHNPEQGRPGRVAGTRELSVTGTPYVVVYRVMPGSIDILRVHHTRRTWPPPMARS